MAAALTLRVPTGLPLTNAQVDNNFSALNAYGNTINSNVGIISNLTTSATGNLVVAINEIKGGVLSQFGSTTSAELASIISDETGSGALVFATSPTLVTPILGTPTSGTLTYCTFPTLNQSTTGSAATLTTSRNINGVAFNGSADITITAVAAASSLTGSTLASGVTLSSLTQVGTISFGVWNGSSISTTYTDAKVTSVNSSTGAVTGLATTAGTLAQFGATTSAQLLSIISDETGTGALVFANSPTLVNPALGTPFSGDLTNCTIPAPTVTDDTSTNSTHYIRLAAGTSSNQATKVSSTKLFFNPSTGLLTSTDYNSSSDISLKENFVPISNPLDIIDQLKGFGFTWKDSKEKSYGLSAQDVEKVIPEIVKSRPDGTKGINYLNIIAFLVEAVKDLKQEVQQLKKYK